MYRSSRLMAQCIIKSMKKYILWSFDKIAMFFLLIFFAYSESVTSKMYKIKWRLLNSVKYRQNYTQFRFSYCFFGGHFEWRHNMLLSAVRVCYPARRGPHFSSPWLADYDYHDKPIFTFLFNPCRLRFNLCVSRIQVLTLVVLGCTF